MFSLEFNTSQTNHNQFFVGFEHLQEEEEEEKKSLTNQRRRRAHHWIDTTMKNQAGFLLSIGFPIRLHWMWKPTFDAIVVQFNSHEIWCSTQFIWNFESSLSMEKVRMVCGLWIAID